MARGEYRREEQVSSNKPDIDSIGRLKDFNKHFKPQFDKNGKERKEDAINGANKTRDHG